MPPESPAPNPLWALPEAVVGPGQAPQHPVVPQHQHPGRVQPGDTGQQFSIPTGPACSPVKSGGPVPVADVRGPNALLHAPLALQLGVLRLRAAGCGQLVSTRRKVPLDAAVGGQHRHAGQLRVGQEALQVQGLQVRAEVLLGAWAQEEYQFLPCNMENRGTEGGGRVSWQGLTLARSAFLSSSPTRCAMKEQTLCGQQTQPSLSCPSC